MKSKILFSHSYYYKLDQKQWLTNSPFPPLGTIYACSFMREKDYEVSLFDVGLKESPDEIVEQLIQEKPKYLVIYDDGFNYLTKMCLTNMREACFKMISIGKKYNCIIIINSSDSTDQAKMYLENGADYIIYGEGENTLLDLISTIDKNEITENLDGIIYLENEKLKKNKAKKLFKNLDELPFPAWDLIDVNSYREIWENAGKEFTLNIATTRGCPYHCNWCAKPIFGQNYNTHSHTRIVEIIDYLGKQHQVKRFWMCDDIFGLKQKWVQRFNDELKVKNLKIKYYIQSRADLLLKENNIEVMAESGLEEVWIGAESGSQKILDAMDKGTTIEQIESATKLLQAKGVRVALFIQYGYLGETKQDIDKTLAMIKKLNPDDIGISVSYPLPDTPFYETVKSQLKNKKNWEDSNDLAMMFQGTFSKEYYRILHNYTHKIYQANKGFVNVFKILKNPFSINKKILKTIILAPLLYFNAFKDEKLLNEIAKNE